MKKKLLAILLLVAMLISLCACGGEETASAQAESTVSEAVPEVEVSPAEPAMEETPEAPVEEASVEEEVSVAGTYTFEESAMDGAFVVPWILELREDGTYTITEENPFMGTLTYNGEYTYDGEIVTTGPFPEEPPLADFFEEDTSCQWKLEGENCVPVKYAGAVAEALTPETAAGIYTFEESAMNGAFTVNWVLELRADSTYTITEENPFMGTLSYEGSYTIEDNVIVCGGFEGEPPIAEFFAEDKTSRWLLDGKTCTPESLVSGEADASESDADFADVAYGTLSDSQAMDIHLPEGEGPFPVIVLVHGGGFLFGDQNMAVIQPVIAEGTARGYAVASVDYRKSNEAVFPGALSDVKAAVRFLKANAAEYGIDPEKMVIWGESAGAYLSLMTALTPDVESLNGDMTDNLTESSAVPVLVDFYGPVEFYAMDDEAAELGMDVSFGEADSFESKFLGQALTQDKEKTDTTWWETYKDQLPADFKLKAWIQAGDADASVPYTQSENFALGLAETIGEDNVEFSIIPGADHEDDLFYTADNLEKVFAFIKEVLS